MIAALYLRKSNDEGDKNADVKSVAVQRDLVSKFIADHGWTVGPEFSDDGLSGGLFERPGLQALMAAAKTKAFGVIVVVEQSRLARESTDVAILLRDFRRLGIDAWATRSNRLL